MEDINNPQSLLRELERLVKAVEAGDVQAVLDIDDLPVEEQENARLFNRVLGHYRTAAECELAKHRLTANALGIAYWEVLEKILDEMDSYIYVSDLETDEILFANKKLEACLGKTKRLKGDKCWKRLQPGMEKRCDFCPKSRLLANPDEPVLSKKYNSILGRTFSVVDRMIEWPGGERVHLEQATEIRETSERAKLMLNATPFACVLWDSNIKAIDCNEASVKLLGFKSREDHLERLFTSFPEYQPDGRRSDEKAIALVRRAFDEGSCVFEWMHQSLDGTLIPTEVTLTRVNHEDGLVVVGYTRDLRTIRKMEEHILQLESEKEKIYYDQLTGIYNRRFFEERMSSLIKALSRSMSTLSMMMIDIDYFKLYNDTYGHVEGDNCLRMIANILQNNIKRKDDFIARYGGEEFVAVMPYTDEKGACMLAERLLENVRKRNIPHNKSNVADCVTVSIGVITGKVEYTHSGNDFIQSADVMLYQAKQGGRNRYSFAFL